MSAVASSLGAPSGSIYHRFGSRDILVATLWIRAVEHFQQAIAPALGLDDPHEAIGEVARRVVVWAREYSQQAGVLLVHRSSDLLGNGWPVELTDRNLAQRARTDQMIATLCRRMGATTAEDRRRVVFAAIDIPYAAVRAPLSRGESPPADLETVVGDAVRGVLSCFDRHPREST